MDPLHGHHSTKDYDGKAQYRASGVGTLEVVWTRVGINRVFGMILLRYALFVPLLYRDAYLLLL